jgi:hypothetical protein
MGRAKITNGVWTRNVPWEHNGEWRTDIFKSTLSDCRLRFARFVLNGGPAIVIPADDLRRVITGGPNHYANKIWGPFNINPTTGTVDRNRVQMNVIT